MRTFFWCNETGRNPINVCISTTESPYVYHVSNYEHRTWVWGVCQSSFYQNKLFLFQPPKPKSCFLLAVTDITLLWKWEGKIEAVNPENRWTSLLMELRSTQSLMDVPNLLLKDENAGLETANISVAFKYLCSKNYYGPNCNHYCDPRHSVMTHYRCHPQTGAIVCQPGWKGTNCNQGKLFVWSYRSRLVSFNSMLCLVWVMYSYKI